MGGGGRRQSSTFLEYGHALQIKRNDAYDNMGANILQDRHTLDPRDEIKGRNIFSLKVVMLHIKLKEMECRVPCKQIFCPYTHINPWGGVKSSKQDCYLIILARAMFQSRSIMLLCMLGRLMH